MAKKDLSISKKLILDIEELYLTYGPKILTKAGFFGIIQIARYTFGVICCYMVWLVLFERTLATINYKTYEKWKSYKLIIFAPLLAIITASIVAILFCIGTIPNVLYVAIPCFIVGGSAMSVSSFQTFHSNTQRFQNRLIQEPLFLG
jgi:hypothetical protein